MPEPLHSLGVPIGTCGLRVASPNPAATAAQILVSLGSNADQLQSLEVVQPSLEAVFLSLTGRRLHEDGQPS